MSIPNNIAEIIWNYLIEWGYASTFSSSHVLGTITNFSGSHQGLFTQILWWVGPGDNRPISFLEARQWKNLEIYYRLRTDLHDPNSIPKLKEFLECPTKFPCPRRSETNEK